jgi:DNA-binding response OmpR family regulator
MRLDNQILGPAAVHSRTLPKRQKPLKGARVLIVEDEILQALALEDIIVKLGGAPVIVCRFEHAMEALDSGEFDCALLDVNLGGTLSFPIARRLQQQGVPILFCTAYVDDAMHFAGEGPIACFDKPIEKDGLRDALLGLLKQAL